VEVDMPIRGRLGATRRPLWLALVVLMLAPSGAFAQVTGWESLGAPPGGWIQEAPECVSWGANRIDCFGRGGDWGLWHKFFDGANWRGWEPLGGTILETPECVSWGPNRLDCFARGQDLALYQRFFDGQNWGGWMRLGGTLQEQPSCVSWGPNRIDCFARFTDWTMRHIYFDGSNWSDWGDHHPGVILNPPSCVSWGPERIDCFARGTDAAMWHRYFDGANWWGWEPLFGTIVEQPNCVSWGPGRIDCFARSTDAAMWHQFFDGYNWSGWETLGGSLLGRPECVSQGWGRLDCFARGTDQSLIHQSFDGANWSGWHSFGGVLLEQPSCVSWGVNRLDCFARRPDLAMWHRWWPCPECVVIGSRLDVRRHVTAMLSDADADAILAAATTVLQTNDGPGDVECAVQLARSRPVTTFSGISTINTAADFEAVMALPGNVKVVNAINWCENKFKTDYIGCARRPGTSLAVERFLGPPEGVLWAHEFGHNKGLRHLDNDPFAVMNPTITGSHRRISSVECAAYRAAPFTPDRQAEVLMSTVDLPRLPDVREFVRQVYVHGVPYQTARRYPASQVPILVEMLRQPAEEAAWRSIVVTLGMIGDEAAVEPLIAFIEARGPDQPSRAQYAARRSAVTSLGYILNQTRSRRALDYLETGLEPSQWAARLEPFHAPYQATVAERDRDFSTHALLGLALSGTPEAAEALRGLQQNGGTPSEFAGQVRDLLADALKAHAAIAAEGLEAYYREKSR
jgi:PBS lyase HEAT-like repeat-containing protein